MSGAETILAVVRIWLMLGGLVAAVFLTIGIDRVDEDARGAYVFRPLLVPAILLIWPLVLWRWWVLETGRDHWPRRYAPPRAIHGPVAVGVAVALVAAIVLGLMQRQSWPGDIAPQQISAAPDVNG